MFAPLLLAMHFLSGPGAKASRGYGVPDAAARMLLARR
jgi:hypothetical protein